MQNAEVVLGVQLERTTGFEPATLTLASRYWRKLANASDR